jgi:predicted nucleotidyltransferase
METKQSRQKFVEILENESSCLKEQYGVARIALYGSFAKDEASEASDVDLLVELTRPLGFEFVALAEHLESVLGRKVDLSTFETLRRSMKNPRYRAIALDIQRTMTDVPL